MGGGEGGEMSRKLGKKKNKNIEDWEIFSSSLVGKGESL